MTVRPTSEALHGRVRAFVEGILRGAPPEPFDDLALALARFQAAHVPALGRLVRARGIDLASARDAAVIPALPCDVFRLARIAAHAPDEDTLVFRTSGTSQGKEARGEHPFRTTATYELVALRWGERMLWPDRQDLGVLVLAPSVEEVADSSLGFMLDLFTRELGGPVSFHVRGGVLDIDGVARAAAEARAAGRPALVLGASFAFVHLLDGAGARDLSLPPGSRVMQTGGFKGRSREVEPTELRRAMASLFAVPEAHIVGEYGMTELSSQLYEGTLAAALGARSPARHGVYAPPPWMRVTACEPTTLAPLSLGETGILRFVDLANVDSSVAIQTSDLGRVTDEGVELFGRAPGATPRGCSLAIDEVLSRGSS
ncbi:acyl-protein synthetase [Polyangium fumosum]|uniref:Acyl-protein synthetase n=1 Tax=Polyangium fumosum TaxID=889272 RepID=A0A4U1JKF7_9BACT|nr:acyl-protein synthetase [Polyangium fumosum]TKD13259.1 acyl-protein synthetase [Polyangium fumosum]